MSFWSRLFGIASVSTIAQAREGDAVLEGIVEVIDEDELIGDPVSGDLCVFVQYFATIPGYAERMMIVGGAGPLQRIAKSAQGTDFYLRDASGLALVQPRARADLRALHQDLASRHGFDMEAETWQIRAGDRVRVRGQVRRMMDSSPMRRDPYELVVAAVTVESL